MFKFNGIGKVKKVEKGDPKNAMPIATIWVRGDKRLRVNSGQETIPQDMPITVMGAKAVEFMALMPGTQVFVQGEVCFSKATGKPDFRLNWLDRMPKYEILEDATLTEQQKDLMLELANG